MTLSRLVHVYQFEAAFFVVKGSVVLSPSPAIAADGEPFTLTCTYSGSETVLGFRWELNGNTLAIILVPACTPFGNPGPPDSTLYDYDCPSDKQSTFTVKQISNNNNGNNWQCRAATPEYLESNTVTIIVQVSVSSVSLSPPTGSIKENIETIFTCETSSSRPAATITWYKEATNGQRQTITSKVSSTTQIVGDQEKTTSVLKYTPARTDNGYKIYCEASNIPGKKVKSSNFSMNVLYSPDSPPKIQPSVNTYKVIENTPGSLSCEMKGGNPLATLSWSCFNNGQSSITSGITVTKTVQWNATRGPDISCTCTSSHPVAGSQYVSVNIQVLYKPDSPSFKVNDNQVSGPISFIYGKSRSVVCASNGKPNPDSYSWQKAGGFIRTGNTLTLNPVQKHDDGQFTCTANNTMAPSGKDQQIGSSSSTVKINVLYAPKLEDIGDKEIVVGSKFTLICPVIKGNPSASTFEWTRDSDSRTWNSQTLEINNITKNDDMVYTCKVKYVMIPTGRPHEDGTDSKSFHLIVLYMASVTSFTVSGSQNPLSYTVDEGANVPPFICNVDSNPGSSIEIQFLDNVLHKIENVNMLTYNIIEASCLDIGVYSCSAANQYNSGKTSERKFNLFVRCLPRPLVSVNENVTSDLRYQSVFSFKGLAYPTPTFTWTRRQGNEMKPLSNNSNTIITVAGADTNLTINNVTQSDYGEYQLKIENEIGHIIQHFYLIPGGVPETPTGLEAVEDHISESSVLLQWKPGFDGGLEQTFILMYKKTTTHTWIKRSVVDNNDLMLNYTLKNLVSNSEYRVIIFSQNNIGRSIGSASMTFMTKAYQRDIETYSKQAMIGGVVGGLIGGIVLCSIVVIASRLLLKRHIIPCRDTLKDANDKPGTSEQNYEDLNHTPYVNTNLVYDSLQSESDNASSSNRCEYMHLEARDQRPDDKSVYTTLEQNIDKDEERKVYVNTAI